MKPLLCALLLGSSSCALNTHRPAPPEDCTSTNALRALSFDPAAPDSLLGDFRLVLVHTNWPADRHLFASRPVISLLPRDAALQRSELASLSSDMRARATLIGYVEPAPDVLTPGIAVLLGDTLLFGCLGCMGGGVTRLRVEGLLPEGFVGTWRQTGITLAMPKTRELLPDAAGFFCAWRVTGGSAAPMPN